jgi:hypothetical protein
MPNSTHDPTRSDQIRHRSTGDSLILACIAGCVGQDVSLTRRNGMHIYDHICLMLMCGSFPLESHGSLSAPIISRVDISETLLLGAI